MSPRNWNRPLPTSSDSTPTPGSIFTNFSRSASESRPFLHQDPAPLEQVGPAIGYLHPMGIDVRQGEHEELAGRVRALRRPVPEGRARSGKIHQLADTKHIISPTLESFPTNLPTWTDRRLWVNRRCGGKRSVGPCWSGRAEVVNGVVSPGVV